MTELKDSIFVTLGWWLIATLFFGSIYLIGAFISWDWFWMCISLDSSCSFFYGYLRFSLIFGLIVGLIKGWVLYFYRRY